MSKRKIKNAICVVGWYYCYTALYDHLLRINNKYNIFIVAHRYNEILDKLKIPYNVIKNIGLEYGAYSWYVTNVWNRKSNVLFIQDDLIIKKNNAFEEIFHTGKKYDFIKWGNPYGKQKVGGRCIYCSKLFIKVNNFGFNKIDFGYRGNMGYYDPAYKELNKSELKTQRSAFTYCYRKTHKKHNFKILSSRRYKYIDFCRKGMRPLDYAKFKKNKCNKRKWSVIDNSIFNKTLENKMDKIAKKLCIFRSCDISKGKEYSKWYDFYFQHIKNEELDILEFLINNKNDNNLVFWKKYFVRGFVHGVTLNKNEQEDNIYYSKNMSKEDIDIILNVPKNGYDIMVDNGLLFNKDRIKTFEYIFKSLNPGGIYVFEGLRSQYADKSNNIVEYLKEKLDVINLYGRSPNFNYEYFFQEENEKMGYYEKAIASIHFYFDICFVFKRYLR